MREQLDFILNLVFMEHQKYLKILMISTLVEFFTSITPKQNSNMYIAERFSLTENPSAFSILRR